MHAPLLATRHPTVSVEPDAIFVRDGRVWSSAGVTTGIDLALALIEQDAGREVAMHVARILVVYLKRAGGQSQYSTLLAAQAESESETFSKLEQWIAEHPKEAIRVDAAQRRLAETNDRIEFIAEACGFSNEEQMRCAFIRIMKIPPREYRKRFASIAPPSTASMRGGDGPFT
jgi:transcriptional regulator GlxA family with amidase domain